jgi:hypothetical protein
VLKYYEMWKLRRVSQVILLKRTVGGPARDTENGQEILP